VHWRKASNRRYNLGYSEQSGSLRSQLGAIGRMIMRETDEAWEHTLEYEGFRPVPGVR
jgi:hypothetical protein